MLLANWISFAMTAPSTEELKYGFILRWRTAPVNILELLKPWTVEMLCSPPAATVMGNHFTRMV